MFRRTLVLCLSLGLAFSASAKQAPLPMPLAQQLPVELVLNQQEIGVDVPDNSAVASQFGLLGALIGAAIETAEVKNGEKRIVDLRNELIDYHFNDKLSAAVRAKFPSEGISPQPQITVMPTPWDSEKAAQENEQPRKGIMVVVPRYAMYNTFEGMKVSLTVYLVDRDRKSNGKLKERIHYIKSYTYNINLNKITGSGATEDAQRWSELGKDKLVGLLDEAVEQLTDMVVYDFSAQGRAEAGVKVKHESTVVSGVTIGGHQVRAGKDWAWVRTSVWSFSYINGYHPLNLPAARVVEAATSTVTAPSATVAAPVATAVSASAPVSTPAAATAAAPSAAAVTTPTAAAAAPVAVEAAAPANSAATPATPDSAAKPVEGGQ